MNYKKNHNKLYITTEILNQQHSIVNTNEILTTVLVVKILY